MIIRTITLENWRSFKEPYTVVLTDGLNIIYGDNGQGKSTLMEALRMGFFDRHSTGGDEVKRLKPWGCELSPQVLIEFQYKGTEYRLTKRFITKSCLVEKVGSSGEYERFMESDSADEWLRGILGGESVGRGLSKQEHLGLARLLWIPQGSMDFGGLSSTMKNSISGQNQGNLTSVSTFEVALKKEYLAFFTEKGSPRQTAGSISDLQNRLEEYRKELQKLQKDLSRMDSLRENLNSGEVKVRLWQEEIETLKNKIRLSEENLKRFNTLKNSIDSIKDKRDILQGQIDSLQKTIVDIKETDHKLASEKEQLSSLGDQFIKINKALQEIELKIEQENISKGKLLKEEEVADNYRIMCSDAIRYNEFKKRLMEVTAREEKFRQLQSSFEQVNKKLGAIKTVDKEKLLELRSLKDELSRAESALHASTLKLEFKAETCINWKPLSGEPSEEKEISSGESVFLEGLGKLTVHIPEIGLIKISGPVDQNAEKLQKKISDIRNKLGSYRQEFGTDNAEILQDRLQKASELTKEVNSIREMMKQVLEGKSFGRVLQEATNFRAVLEELESKYPEWKSTMPVVEQLSQQAESSARQIRSRGEEIQLRERALLSEKATMAERAGDLKRRTEEHQTMLESLAVKSAQLRNSKTVSELETELSILSGKLFHVEQDEQLRKVEMEKIGDDPEPALVEYRGKLEFINRLYQEKLQDISRISGELATLGGMGIYSEIGDLEEKITSLQGTIEFNSLRAESLKLIWDTLDQTRRLVQEQVSFPVEKRASDLFSQINPRRRGMIKLDTNFRVCGYIPELLSEAAASVDNLSGGEREQLYLCTRLALAENLIGSEAGKQPLILDDFLTYTDCNCLGKIKRLILSMSSQYQLIILTCHPERYGDMSNANLVEIRN